MRNYYEMSTEELSRLLGYQVEDTPAARMLAVTSLQRRDQSIQSELPELQREETEDQFYRLEKQYEDTKEAIEDSDVLTQGEKDRRLLDLEALKGTSQMTGFGSVQELGTPKTGATPLEQPQVLSDWDLFIQPLLRTTSISPTLAKEDRPIIQDINRNFESMLSQAYSELPPAERRGAIAGGMQILRSVMSENPSLSPGQQWDLAADRLEQMEKGAPNITPEQAAVIDPEYAPSQKKDMTGLEMTAEALDFQKTTGTDLPMYSQEQLDYFNTIQNAKYNPEIETQLKLLENPPTNEDRYVRTLKFKLDNGRLLFVPTETAEYIFDNPLGGSVYDADTDLQILRKYKNNEFTVSPTSLDVTRNEQAREGLAKVRAYGALGNPDWKKSQEKREVVLENIREFDNKGWIKTETAIGGTGDATAAWLFRAALAPSSAFAAVAYEGLDQAIGSLIGLGFEGAEMAGLVGEADYIGEAGFTGAREEALTEKYKGYGLKGRVAENVALSKGFTGEAEAVANSLNLDTAFDPHGAFGLNPYISAGIDTLIRSGGAMMDVGIDPTSDVIIAAPKALGAANRTWKAHKAIYGAGSVQESLKAMAKTAGPEIDLIQGSLSLANKYDTRIPKNITPDDLSVTMGDKVSENLQAAKMVEKGYNYDYLSAQGLENTTVAKRLAETGDAQQAVDSFFAEIKKNPKAAQILEEYKQTDELVSIMRGTDAPTQKALTYNKRFRDLPNADIKQAKRAIEAANEGLGTPTKNLARIYGRNLFYTVAPQLPIVDNLVWFTRNTLVQKGKFKELFAKAANTPAAKSVSKVLGKERILAQRMTRTTGSDILGQGITVKPTETLEAYDLQNMDIQEIEEIKKVVEGLELPTALKQEIVQDIEGEGLLFLDDYNTIRSAIRDRVARIDREGISIEDLNRLEGEAQQRMLEASDTVYRDKGLGLSTLSAGAVNALEGILDFTVGGKKIKDRISPQTIDAAFKALGKPVVNTSESIGVEMRRVFKEHNKSMATLGFRTQERFRELIEGNQDIIGRYIDPATAPKELTGTQVIGLMTVGERSIGIGKVEQANNLSTSMKWMLDNMFLRKVDRVPLNYSQMDRASGLGEVTTPTIWNPHGEAYINQELDKIADKVVNDPLAYWGELQRIMEDLNDAIQNPMNRNRVLEVETATGVERIEQPIVDPNVTSDNVDSLDALQINKRFGLIGLSTYYVAESNRIMARVLSDSLQKDFKSLVVEDITSAPISQGTFEASVQEAAKIVYDNNNVKASQQDVFNKIKRVVQEAHTEEVIRNLDTTINVDRLDSEILKEFRASQAGLNKAVAMEYKTANSRISENIKLELEVIQEENAEKIKKALEKFDTDKASEIRVKKRELEQKFDEDLAAIPEEKRKNPVLVELRNKREAELKAVTERNTTLSKAITNQKKKGKITKQEAEEKRKKLKALREDKEKQIRKDYGAKIDAELAKHDVNAEDSQAVRDLKAKLAEDKNNLNKPYVLPRKQLRDKLSDQLRNEKNARKEELFQQKEEFLRSIIDSKSDSEDILKAKEDLAGLETIEEKIEYLKNNVSDYNDEYDTLLESISDAQLSDVDLVDVADQVENYANVVLRNNNYSYGKARGAYNDIEQGIDTLFNKNEGFARAMFGNDTFEQLKNELVTKTKAQRQRIIIEALNSAPEATDLMQQLIDTTNEAFYINVLGLDVASHMRNTISAPTIVYQTTGKILKPKDIASGIDVVAHGRRIGSKKYGQIAVTTPDGMVYTNADLYNILQESGVKSQFQFLQSEMGRGGKLIRQIDAMKDKNLSQWSESWLKNTGKKLVGAPRAMTEFQTYEDMTFRASVLTSALREGRSVEEAAALASRSMFDYSDIDPGLNKWLRAAFVFTSFRIQNLKEFYRALSNPSKLKRYLKILYATRTTNAYLRSNNQNKQLPYQMYYPEYAQNRIVWEINHYNDRVPFAMAPSIPAIDSMTEMIGWLALAQRPVGVLEAKDVELSEMISKQLSPLIKEVIKPANKYESSKVKPEVVRLFQMGNDDMSPSQVAEMLERYAGGTVQPKLAQPGDKNAVNGYVYNLTGKQREQLYHGSIWTMLTILGSSNLISKSVKALDPEGTTWQSLDPFQRSLAFLGLYSVSEAKNVEVQQSQKMRAITSEMKRMQTTMENLEEELD